MDWAMPHARMVGGANDDDVHAFLHTNIRTGRRPGQKPQSDIMVLPSPLNDEKTDGKATASRPVTPSFNSVHIKRAISRLVLLLALLLFSSPSALAYDCCIDGIYYNLDNWNNTAEVTKNYNSEIKYEGDIVIPEKIIYENKTYPVTSIRAYAFAWCPDLTSVAIPRTVTSMGAAAFQDCFKLEKVNIPSSVPTIEDHLFYRCEKLAAILIPNAVTSIEKEAFFDCASLTSVNIPEMVTSIGDYAFYLCKSLTSVVLPDAVTSIGDYAFSGCPNLVSVSLGNSVTHLGSSAFEHCSGLTSIIIPNSVVAINDRTFLECSGLTSVTIGNSVTSIGGMAFHMCSSLVSLTLPNQVHTIGDKAFQCCIGLKTVIIGNSVATIGENAFNTCDRITEFICTSNTPPTCGSKALFSIDKKVCQLFVPVASIEAYKVADQWKDFIHILGRSGVDDVDMDTLDAVYEVYNLQGVRVGSGMREAEVTADALPHGVYILVSPQGRKKIQI